MHCSASPQYEAPAARLQVASEGDQAMMQPPSTRSADPPAPRCFIIEQIKAEDWPIGGYCRRQGGIVREPQILAQPYQCRCDANVFDHS